MSLNIQNLEWLRKLSPTRFEDLQQLGSKLYGALQSVQQGVRNIETQTNSDATNPPQAPPPIDNFQVTANNGHFQVAITDNNQIYRGIQYFVEHADNPNFSNAITVPMGTSRNANLFLGNSTRYWQAYSAYPTSGPSTPIFHGGLTPTPVSGGGSVSGPSFLSSQGSGTGDAGIGLQGPGTVQYRSSTGALPIRQSPAPLTPAAMRSNGATAGATTITPSGGSIGNTSGGSGGGGGGGGGGGTGTVTSVGLTMPSEFTVTGSPITNSGTFAVTKNSESAGTFWGGPVVGSAAAPVFRALAEPDYPFHSESLTDGNANFIFDATLTHGGDIITVVGLPNGV